MPLTNRIASLWRTLFHKARLDRELDDELRTYLETQVERKVQAGIARDTARRDALIEMGGIAAVTEQVRDARIGNGLETTAMDVRYAWRSVRRSPGFAFAAVATLALGIGANTAIFSVVRTMLIAPLPYRDSSRLVFVWSDMTAAGYPRAPLSGPELVDLRERGTLFETFGAIWATTTALTGDGDPEQLRIGLTTTNFFTLLGADAALGRTFAADDEVRDAPRTILLGWTLFQRRFGGNAHIVGQSIRVNGQPVTVIGVMPAAFQVLLPPDAGVPDDLQAWQPLNSQGLRQRPRGQQFLRVVGRMKPDVTINQARTQVDAIAAAISREFTSYGSAGRVFTTVGLQSDSVRSLRPVLLALFAGVSVLLMIACVNVAGLLLARAASRQRETAVRLAIGASRARIVRQCLVEGLLLAVFGAAAGLLAGRWGLTLLLALRPATLNRLAGARLDIPVLSFTATLALLWGVLFSFAPAIEVGRASLTSSVQHGEWRTRGSIAQRTRAMLVVLQIALSAVLCVNAVLLVRTFIKMQQVDPGFRAGDILSFRIALPASRYGSSDAFNAFGRQLQASLAAVPGVTGIGAISHMPYDNLPNWGGPYIAQPGQDEATAVFADHRAVTPGYFETVGVRLVAGRFFTEDDGPASEPVVIVDDQLARRTWPGGSAIGRRIASDPRSTGHPVFWATVVGVVGHMRHRSLVDDLTDQVYFADRQVLRNPMVYVVKGSNAADLAPAVKSIVAKLDPQLPVYDIRPMEDFVVAARAAQRFTMILALAFAAVALLLAAVGVYGVVAYSVTRRRYEFGVRLALGARPRSVVALVMREGVSLAAVGIAIGGAAAAMAARLLEQQLFGVTASDAISYAAAAAAIAAAALLATWVPASRASAISPIDALRAD